jgi:hypothetical protein
MFFAFGATFVAFFCKMVHRSAFLFMRDGSRGLSQKCRQFQSLMAFGLFSLLLCSVLADDIYGNTLKGGIAICLLP